MLALSLVISSVDIVVIAVYLIATVALGVWIGRRGSTSKDYFLGNKELPWGALLLSIVASETSTVTFLSVPGLAFKDGGNLFFLQLAAGFVIGRILVAFVLLPHYFSGSLFTSYELLESRTGVATRRLSSLLFLASRTVGDALRLYLTALVLNKVIGLNLPVCVVVVGVATIIYTFAGGLKSVVWNDCIQFVIYIAGALWALHTMTQNSPDGWSGMWQFARETGRLDFIEWDLGAGGINLWVGVIGGGFLAFASHGTDHLIVQRLLGSKSKGDAQKALVLSGAVVFLQFALFLVIGLALAYFFHHAPPEKEFATNDEVFASYIVNHMGVGVVGLILAAVFAAAMSTQSSSLNSLAGAAVNDFYKPFAGDEVADEKLTRAGKYATIGFGIAQMAVAILTYKFVSDRSTIDNVLQIAAFMYGPVLGLFFLAMIQKRSYPMSNVIGFAAGLATLIALKLLSLGEQPMLSLSGLWYTMIGSIVTLTVALLASRFAKDKEV